MCVLCERAWVYVLWCICCFSELVWGSSKDGDVIFLETLPIQGIYGLLQIETFGIEFLKTNI